MCVLRLSVLLICKLINISEPYQNTEDSGSSMPMGFKDEKKQMIIKPRFIISIILTGFIVIGLSAQTTPDSVHVHSIVRKSPRHAMFRSAVLPGWGQAYNGNWFLVPRQLWPAMPYIITGRLWQANHKMNDYSMNTIVILLYGGLPGSIC